MTKLIIFDTTLRDGEQAPGASMTKSQKLIIAAQLARLNVDVIEAGFPIASPDDFEAVRAIATHIQGPIICALARANEADIERAAAAIAPAGARGRIHVFLATSEIHRRHKFHGSSQEEILRRAVAAVLCAKRFASDVEFSPEDGSRTEPAFLIRVARAVIDAGATTVNIPDTVGYAMPEQFQRLIEQLCGAIPEFVSGQVILSVHCHDDLGLAVANSLAAIRGGARQVEATINGIGERAGNASLEEIVMALRTRHDFFGDISTGVNTLECVRISKMVAEASGFSVSPNKAIVGRNAFAHEAGIHQDGVLKSPETYEIMRPQDVGWNCGNLPLGKHSGKAGLSERLRSLGVHLSSAEIDEFFPRFKALADGKKEVFDEDLFYLLGRERETSKVWALDSLVYSGMSEAGSYRAAVRLRRSGSAELVSSEAEGDGPLDASVKAVQKITGIYGALLEYRTEGLSQGEDALGKTMVQVRFDDGKICMGKASHTDIVQAGAEAYLEAVNASLLPFHCSSSNMI